MRCLSSSSSTVRRNAAPALASCTSKAVRAPSLLPLSPSLVPVSVVHPSSGAHSRTPTWVSAAEGSTSTTTVTTEAPPAQGLHELNKDTFYPYLESQGDRLVIVDFYTDWCGPCKVIYPELVKLAQARPELSIVKFNCNKANKELGVKLGIKVAPTFHLYKNSVKVGEMSGAKLESLLNLIEKTQAEPSAAQ